jgi:hypothetical protein
VIAAGIANPDAVIKKVAFQSATERPGLVQPIVNFLMSLRTGGDGELIDYAVAALMSTPQGAREAQRLKSNELLVGFIERSEQAKY